MQIYIFDNNTKEYLYEKPANLDPKETQIQGKDVYLVPPYATTKTPLPAQENKSQIFINDNWQYIDDFRENFSKVDQFLNVYEITTLGSQGNYIVVTKEFGELIKQNPGNYKIVNNEVVEKTAEDKYNERKAGFLKQFFKVSNIGYYRKTPKGYQSAIESINTAFNLCNKIGGLPADTLIFYEEPDFSKEEECTEEWLVEHQIKLPAMTAQQFDDLYVTFVTSWNEEEH